MPPPLHSLAFQATLHCLLGCGLGQAAGWIAARAMGLETPASIAMAVAAGIVSGVVLGVWPKMNLGIGLGEALWSVLSTDTLSFAAMTAAQALAAIYLTEVTVAALTGGSFWLGLSQALATGFAAALPANTVMAAFGVRPHR